MCIRDRSHTGITENDLNEQCAAKETGEPCSPDRNDGQQRVRNGVAQDHAARTQPLTMCRADIVLIQHLKQARTRNTHQDSHHPETGGYRRQNQVFVETRAADWQNAQLQSEQNLKLNSQPEHWN